MAVNKNFVVKNGLEVDTNLILADATTNKVGIGTTVPGYELHVLGGIGATDVYVGSAATVIGTLSVGSDGTTLTATGSSVGVGTDLPSYLLDVRSPVSTGQTALYVQGDVRVTGDLAVDDITLDQASIANLVVTGIGTIETLDVNIGTIDYLTGTNIYYSGIATAGSISIGSTQVISSGFELQNIASLDATTTATIEAAIANGPNVFTDLEVTGISTLGTVLVSSGIVTATSGIVTYYGDGSNLTGVSTSLVASVGIQSGGTQIGAGITTVNVVGTGFTADASGSTANLYLPAPGASIGLVIALGG
jgi:hypothetical protein